jgi:hypothetical protein
MTAEKVRMCREKAGRGGLDRDDEDMPYVIWSSSFSAWCPYAGDSIGRHSRIAHLQFVAVFPAFGEHLPQSESDDCRPLSKTKPYLYC